HPKCCIPLRIVFWGCYTANEESQIYRAQLPESVTSPEMRETKAYKTYLGYATGVTPSKKARKFKKLASPKLTTVLVSPEEPTRKSKRVKRPANKSTNAPTTGVVIRDTPVTSLSKKKEKVTVEKRKGMELLSEVALTEEAQYEEVRKKSLMDFHKTHPSGSGIVTKLAPSAAKIKPSVTNEGTGTKPGVPHVTEEESTESEAESWEGMKMTTIMIMTQHETDENETGFESDQEENEEEVEDDEEEKDDEFVKTPSNYNSTDGEDETNVESKVKDNAEGDKDKGMDYTTNQFDDDVYVRLNEPVNADEWFIQKEGTDGDMINAEVPVTSSSHSSDLTAKFLNFADIPITNAEIVSPMDVHVHHEIPSNQTPTLLTVPVSVITESLPVYTRVIPQSLPSFTPLPPQSTPTPPPTTEATNPLSALLNFTSILPKEVSNFAPSVIKSMVTESLEHAVLAKESSQPQSTYEAAASLTEFKLKKILIDKMDKSLSYLTATPHKECYDGLLKYYELDKSLFSTYDKVYSLKRSRDDKDKDKDPSAGSHRGLKKKKTSKDAELTKGLKTKESKSGSSKGTKSQLKSSGKSVQAEEPEFEVADSDMPQNQEGNLGNDDEEPLREVASKHDWFTKPKQPQEPTDPDWNVGKTPQQVPTQSWLMTLAATADKPSKTFDELMSTPIDFSAYIMNGLKITNLTQETLLGPALKLLKGTHTNFAELKYDFEECYKALSEKLD
ncbi:hypothetical protein Tco_1181276, partial [Tanacetum coccineum]